MMRRTIRIAALGLLLCAAPAGAQNKPDVEQARTYFKVGAQAYEQGEYMAAVQAFEKAYDLAKRPSLIFSIAQAYRRQYYADKQPQHLRAAIEKYRAYLGMVPTGGRRADVSAALAELEPQLPEAAPPGEDGTVPPPAPAPALKPRTRLMVSSKTEDAVVIVDGGKPDDAPLIAEVKPGKHTVVVRAKGYFDEKRDVSAAEGGIVALDIALRAKPAVVTLKGEDGAGVSIDGRFVGNMPLAPLRLAPGRYLITIAKNGRELFSREMDLGRDEKRTITADLDTTGQRVAAWSLLGAGGAAVITGGVFTLLAFNEDSNASDVLNKRDSQNLTGSDLQAYDDARDARDQYRLLAGISYGAGVALGVTGLVLYAFDEPDAQQPFRSRELIRPDKQGPQPEDDDDSMELSAVPMFSPTLAGAGVVGRF